MYKTTRKNNISRLPQMKHSSLVVQMYLKHLKNRNVFFLSLYRKSTLRTQQEVCRLVICPSTLIAKQWHNSAQ